ncbi:MAG: penicillin-binding transpeptidase domain-containing protein [Actinomycetota bacterium]|nr:penicillin-binding transpeptidase domain-containing protein [Actinomycetota bacterium]
MNPRIRWVGAVMLLCFVVLFIQLNNIQVRQAPKLVKNPLINETASSAVSALRLPRGAIVSADGYVLAESKPVHDYWRWQRIYPPLTAEAFAPITGYYDVVAASDPYGIEAQYDSLLAQHESPTNTLGQLLSQHTETDTVQLTVSEKLQVAAYNVLKAANEPGSAMVVLDPRTGAVLAMAEYPSYNPNGLASHSPKVADAAYKRIAAYPYNDSPLPNLATYRPLAPGSTFKIVTTSAIFDHDPSLATRIYPVESSYSFPNSGNPPQKIHNYASELCGGDLAMALLQSCDTSFSRIGVALGPINLALEARSFGFDSTPPIDLPKAEVAPSIFPSPSQIGATPYMGYSAIGQLDDTATALQMALVAAAIANHGKMMKPYLVSRAVGKYGNIEYQAKPQVWRQATSASTAQQVRKLMLGVTQNPAGTAYGVFQQYGQGMPTMAAKTGTAEPQKNVCGTYNWLVSFGPAGPGETPTVAAAAVVPIPSNSTSCATNPTGASVAGPVLIPILRQALGLAP